MKFCITNEQKTIRSQYQNRLRWNYVTFEFQIDNAHFVANFRIDYKGTRWKIEVQVIIRFLSVSATSIWARFCSRVFGYIANC